MTRFARLIVLGCMVLVCTSEASARGKRKSNSQGEGASTSGGGTSSDARVGKKMGVAAAYTPLSDYVLQFGAQGYYFLGDRLQVGLSVLVGSDSIADKLNDSSRIKVTEANINGTAAYGYGRYFFGNSFNLSAGLGYRAAKGEFRAEDTITEDYVENGFSITSIVVPVTIGNHWSWGSGFTIGVDWLMVMVPITGGSKSETKSSVQSSDLQDLNKEIVDMGEGLAKTASLTLFLTSIGYQF